MKKLAIVLPGLLAWIVSLVLPVLDALFLALLFGIATSAVFKGEELKKDSERMLAVTLPAGIVLYGFKARIPSHVPLSVVAITTFSALTMGLFVYFFAKALKVENRLSVLLACGTAICGASAITVLSSIVKPKKEEFSAAILVITVVGLTGVILYPAIRHVFNLSNYEYAVLCGATLHQTGLVETATRPFGEAIMREALSVKSIRIALISVAALILSKKRFYVPWYIFAFVVVSALSSFMLPLSTVKMVEPLSTLAFSLTLSSIGISVSISDVQGVGVKPLLSSYAGWLLALLIVLALLHIPQTSF